MPTPRSQDWGLSCSVQRMVCTDFLKPGGLGTQLVQRETPLDIRSAARAPRSVSAEADSLRYVRNAEDCTTLPLLINDLRSQFDVLRLKVEHSNAQWTAAIARQDQASSRHEGLLERISDAVHRSLLTDEASKLHQQLQPVPGPRLNNSQGFSLAPAPPGIPEPPSMSATLLTSTLTQRDSVFTDCPKDPITSQEVRSNNGRRNSLSDHDTITRAKREELVSTHNMLQRIVSSRHFETFFGLLLLSNAAFIGYQVQYQSTFAEAVDTGAMTTIGHVYTIGFTLEWCLRVLSFGPIDFLKLSKDKTWNICDTVIVSLLVFELIITSIVNGRSEMLQNVGVLRMIRILRLLRLLRIIRSLRFFRELRLMIFSIMNCAKTLLWAMLLLVVMFYIFGVCLTQGIAAFCEDNSNCVREEHALHLAFFGSIPRSVYTLYMAMSGGISWGEPGLPLSDAGHFFVTVYVSFVTLATFAIINIVTSVFVEVTMASAQSDREAMIQDADIKKESLTSSMREIFAEVDGSTDGIITVAELEAGLMDSRLKSYLLALDLNVENVKELFVLCDLDQSGSVDIDEFVDGAMRLGGSASSLDVASLKLSIVTRLNEVTRRLDASLGVPGLPELRPHSDFRRSEVCDRVCDYAPRLLRSVARKKSSGRRATIMA